MRKKCQKQMPLMPRFQYNASELNFSLRLSKQWVHLRFSPPNDPRETYMGVLECNCIGFI